MADVTKNVIILILQKLHYLFSSLLEEPNLRMNKIKPTVLFTGYDNPQQEKIVKDLGGIVTTKISECTILVTDKIRRTAKFLCGLGRGIPIVNENYLISCKMAKTFLGTLILCFKIFIFIQSVS